MRHNRRPRARRAFTLMELMISTCISTMVVVAIASLQYISSRSVKEVYGQTRTRSSRMEALDQIRYRLMNGMVSTVAVTQEGHRITYKDPNKNNATSVFFFTPGTRTLYYDDNIASGSGAQPVIEGPIDITFEIDGKNNQVLVKIKSASNMAYGDVDIQDGETTVTLKNTPQS